MLLTRFLTALALLPLVVGAILYLPTSAVAAVAGAVLAVGAWEWGRLLRLRAASWRVAYAGLVVAVFPLLWWIPEIARGISGAAVAWWPAAVIWIVRFPRGWEATLGRPFAAAALGILILAGALSALIDVHARSQGPFLLLLLFVVIWAADTGAYFAGRFRGRHKLAPRISPGKTREGAVGGVVAATAAAMLGGWWLGEEGLRLAGWLALGATVAVISIAGDLVISMFKRSAGVKDTGAVFPGHGGVLDRLDSLFAAAPIYALGLVLLMS